MFVQTIDILREWAWLGSRRLQPVRSRAMPRRPMHVRHVILVLAACAVVVLGAVVVVGVSKGPANLSARDLSVAVEGTTVTASVRITGAATEHASYAGVCARTSSGGDADFPLDTSVTLEPSGIRYLQSQVLDPGRYTYWACAQVDGSWYEISGRRHFEVPGQEQASAASAPATSPRSTSAPATPNPSTSGPGDMPTGDLPGWKQVFAEDFDTPVALGGFPGPYTGTWMSYNGFKDTSGHGYYDQSIISVHDGYLDLFLHTQDGQALGAAPIPLVGGHWGGQTYGRFSVRMRADSLPNFGIAFLLWPDSENWRDGEIDFPEGALYGPVKWFNHCGGFLPGMNCFRKIANFGFSQWHTYTIDWTPQKITFYIDGTVFGSTTMAIPQVPMHWVGQVGTAGGKKPAPQVAGHLLIDWMTIYTYAP
jgi:hypothetical protein